MCQVSSLKDRIQVSSDLNNETDVHKARLQLQIVTTKGPPTLDDICQLYTLEHLQEAAQMYAAPTRLALYP